MINSNEGNAKTDTMIRRANYDTPLKVKYTINPIMYRTPKMQSDTINMTKYL